MKKKTKVIIAVSCAVFAAGYLWFAELDGFFRYGNPVPYIAAAAKVSEDEPVVKVKTKDGSLVYIADDCPTEDQVKVIEDDLGMQWSDQLGAMIFFGDTETGYRTGFDPWGFHLIRPHDSFWVLKPERTKHD